MAEVKRIVTHPSWDYAEKGTILEIDEAKLTEGSRFLCCTAPYSEPAKPTVKKVSSKK